MDLARFAEEPWVWLSRDASQLAMVDCGFGVTLVPHVTVSGTAFRPLTDRADTVELSPACRSGAQEPLVAEFVRIASG